MIFFSVGTHEVPFDRLVEAADVVQRREPVVLQYGPSRKQTACSVSVAYLAFDDVVSYIQRARAVVMHAGVGSIMISLANGKRPFVVPRRHHLGEHVDDHQLELALRLEAAALVTVVEDPADLPEVLATPVTAPGRLDDVPWLGNELGKYLAAYLGRTPGAALTAP
jgi:UDP-N-acetylglucosamine transferase subunit ALG13